MSESEKRGRKAFSGDLLGEFLDRHGEEIFGAFFENLPPATAGNLLPTYRTIFEAVKSCIRRPPSRTLVKNLIMEVREAVVGRVSEADLRALLSGQVEFWCILRRSLQETEGRHTDPQMIHQNLALARDTLDGVIGFLVNAQRSGDRGHIPWETLMVLGGTHRELWTLNRTARMLLDAREPLEVFRILQEGILDAFHLRSLTLAAVDHQEGIVEVVQDHATHWGNKGAQGWRLPLSGPDILCEVARTGRMEVIDGWDPRYHERMAAADGSETFQQRPRGFNEGHTAFFVPFFAQDRVIGVAATGSRQENREFVLKEIEGMRPFFDQAGAAIVNLLDVSRHRLAEEALRESEERLRLSLQAANQGLYDLNVQTGAAIVNREYAQMLGYDPVTFVETNADWIERLHPDDKEGVAQAYSDYVQGVTPEYRVEFRQMTKNGNLKWILSLGKIVERDAGGKPLRMLGTHTDITERKQSELLLQAAHDRYRSVIGLANGVIYERDHRNHSYSFMSETIEAITGYPSSQITPDIFDSLIEERIIVTVQLG